MGEKGAKETRSRKGADRKEAAYRAQIEEYNANDLGGKLKNKGQEQHMLHHNS